MVQAHGQYVGDNLTVLYNFPGISGANAPNATGVYPTSGLVMSSNLLYGFCAAGGANGSGTVFCVSTNGSNFFDLHDFADPLTMTGGLYPKFGILMSGTNIYGTIYEGGSRGMGSLFTVNADGSGFASLDFTDNQASLPVGAPVLSGDTLFGTTSSGKVLGTVFSIHTNGSDFNIIHSFQSQSTVDQYNEFHYDTTDGASPMCGLVLSLSGQTLYGTTTDGGSATNGGTVFSMNTDGSGFNLLHSFPARFSPQAATEGTQPVAGLLLSPDGTVLYGSTTYGGDSNLGTIFSIHSDGTGFTPLHSIEPDGAPAFQSQISFAQVVSPLVLSANGRLLYGSAVIGNFPYIGAGYTSGGSVFALSTNGSVYAVLHPFGTVFYHGGALDGGLPNTLLRSGKFLYGAAANGGGHNHGNVFSFWLGLTATTTALPASVHTGDTISVVVNVVNTDDEDVTNVQLAGPIAVTGDGGVAFAGPSGPTNALLMQPLDKASFTNLFTATNFGQVTFTAQATGMNAEGVVSSRYATSAVVNIAPRGDLLVKAGAEPTNLYVGAGIYQTVPIPPQVKTNFVETSEISTFDVEVVNNEAFPLVYTLVAKTNNPSWITAYLLQGQDVTQQIINGMTLPSLAPGGTLTVVVQTAATNWSTNSIVLTLGLAADPTLTMDAVQAVSMTVPVPVTLLFHRITYKGFTQTSLLGGIVDITTPLDPVIDDRILGAQPVIGGGLVADEVTPLLIEVQGEYSNLVKFPNGRTFNATTSITSDGSLSGPPLLSRVLDTSVGQWTPLTNFTLGPDHTNAFLLAGPLTSDDVHPFLAGDLSFVVSIIDRTAGSVAGIGNFNVRKPPIFLVHGYASSGDWDPTYVRVLGTTHPANYIANDPDNFVNTIHYGQDVVPGYAVNVTSFPAYKNTMLSLADCAVDLSNQLYVAKSAIQTRWAMTRYDVVAHSQGGLLARMLCSQNSNGKIQAPFRNEDNFFRGRFHRVVTIGSPHNGSRILSYLLCLTVNAANPTSSYSPFYATSPTAGAVAEIMVYTQIAQAKFNPFGPQIQELNDPSPGGNWYPDPAARFHLIRPVIDGGLSPSPTDSYVPPAYRVLNLADPGGGQTVIPRGSDGVVDYDSMACNVPPAPLAPNVYDMPPTLSICHAPPLFLYGAQANETASVDIAIHVIDALDQNGVESPTSTMFASFPVPPLLSNSVWVAINAYASNLLYSPTCATLNEIFPQEIRPMAGTPAKGGPTPAVTNAVASYSYCLVFPTNEPPSGDVQWVVEVYGTNGLSTNGVSWTTSGTNSCQVTVTVAPGLPGDVMLYAYYQDQAGQVVFASGVLVCSQVPAGASLVGIGLLPYNPVLPVGSPVPVQLVALYSDGSTSLRYTPSNSLAAVSSDPSVVSVANPQVWQLLSPGTSQVVLTWSGFSFTNEVTAFVSASDLPVLAISNSGSSTTLSWPLWASSFTLQSNVSLSGGNWQPVRAQPLTNDQQQLNITLPVSQSATYFRLAR